ncbi:MAG TPA: glycogen synthase GlgA [Vicinamibacterales bacterium]|nr:glycogen synthase GlgA [Vicinamibacterales bacterium]
MPRKIAKSVLPPKVVEIKKPKAEKRKPDALRILMIASEAQPFSKTGGLADVASALPKALGKLGHDVTVVTPRYRGVDAGSVVDRVSLEMAGHRFNADLIEARIGPGARVLLLDCPELYDRPGIYYDARGDFADNAVRYAFLSAAAIEWASQQEQEFDIVHSHDWQGGLASAYARRLPNAKRVFTIHNLAYQGIFDKFWVTLLGLSWQDFTINGFEFFDRLSFMKAGLNMADAITTVSPTYADEMQRPEYGGALDGVIRSRHDALAGILNGIDTDEWNPLADPFLPAPFDADSLAGKAKAKRALLEMFGFTITEALLARPVIGMVSRMVDQKGLDLIAAAARDLMSLDATFVIVGTGEPRYQDMWTALARSLPDRVAVFIGFDERRAHLVEAGSDLFMMPSRFEPCGLNQMYSLRYGTVPVVRAVGGLVDTVKPYNPKNGQGNGFLFAEYHPAAMMHALRSALAVYPNKKVWTRLQKNGMRVDFSWDRSAGEYVKLYQRLRRQTPALPKAKVAPKRNPGTPLASKT